MASNTQPTAIAEDERVAIDKTTSQPVETTTANTQPADTAIGTNLDKSETHRTTSNSQMPHGPMRTDTTTAMLNAQNPPSPSSPPKPSSPKLDRTVSTAIGPSTDLDASAPAPAPKDVQDAGPTLRITLLLLSGARHPFNLDAAYLTKRNVQIQGNNPYNLSVYKVKELILREWRGEWETKPSSPSAIRLIHFGKVLDDKTPVKGKFLPVS